MHHLPRVLFNSWMACSSLLISSLKPSIFFSNLINRYIAMAIGKPIFAIALYHSLIPFILSSPDYYSTCPKRSYQFRNNHDPGESGRIMGLKRWYSLSSKKTHQCILTQSTSEPIKAYFGNPAVMAKLVSAVDPWLCVPTFRWVCLFRNCFCNIIIYHSRDKIC